MKKNGSVILILIMMLLALPTHAQEPRRGVFSKVGDSITATPLFLHPLGNGGFYPNGNYDYLQETITYWSSTYTSFTSHSAAAQYGWTSSDLLTPGNFNGVHACLPNETPLECEYRTVQPSVALIMVGTNDILYDVPSDVFRVNLREIINTGRRYGVFPVVSTITPLWDDEAHNLRVLEINRIIKEVAHSEVVYVWDIWAEFQRLTGQGISPDGVHPSAPPDNETGVMTPDKLDFGYNTRNLSALKVLHYLMSLGL